MGYNFGCHYSLHPHEEATQPRLSGEFRSAIREAVSKTDLSLELGPSFNPILEKRAGFNVRVVDHASTEELRSKYDGWGVDTTRLEEVDAVWQGEPMTDLFDHKFDAVVASHVIEHSPDFVQFLNNCGDVLSDQGTVYLLVPDKRYCFDYFQASTDVAKVLGDHKRKATRHSFEAFYREALHVNALMGDQLKGDWTQVHIGLPSFRDGDPRTILARAEDSLGAGHYVDHHEYYFTPSSFAVLVNELAYLGFIDLHLTILTRTKNCEFLAELKKGRGAIADMALDQYLSLKRGLLVHQLFEEKERFDLLTI